MPPPSFATKYALQPPPTGFAAMTEAALFDRAICAARTDVGAVRDLFADTRRVVTPQFMQTMYCVTLDFAAAYGRKDVVCYICDLPDLDPAASKVGFRGLYAAVANGYLDIAQLVFKRLGASIDHTHNAIVRTAATYGHLDCLRWVCDLPGVDPAVALREVRALPSAVPHDRCDTNSSRALPRSQIST